MSSILERLPAGARVLVVRLRSLGDCVLTTPALALLKQFRSDLEIGVMVEPRFAGVYEGNPDVTPLAPSTRVALAWGAKLCLNLHGGPRSASLTVASLARWRAGFQHYRQGWAYNLHIPRAQAILGEERTVHTAEHVASAMFWLGVPRCEIPRARLFAAPLPRGPRPIALIHAFASAADKAWPVDRFLAVARHLRDKGGLDPVFIAGPGDDVSPLAGFRTLAGAPLGDVKSLLASASLFVGNDSGPAHMAAAFGLPVVVLFGTSDPVVWAPWRTRSETIVAPEGLATVPLERVLHAVDRLGVAA